MKTVEEYRRGDENRSASEILADRLHWTFQGEKIGDLVSRGGKEGLQFAFSFGGSNFSYGFGKDTTRQISTMENNVPARSSNSIFLPAKEVLSLHSMILKARETDRSFGFDDTYYDLARALRQIKLKGKNYPEFSESRGKLESLLGGKVEYDEASGRWTFQKGNKKSQHFPMGVTAEGIKKIAILDTLLGNRYLDTESVVFVDEPESALHPRAIFEFLEIIQLLSGRGIQFFMASHSYFVVKKLYLIAQESKASIPVLMAGEEGWQTADLRDGMPDNSIIAESIRLYEQEVERSLR